MVITKRSNLKFWYVQFQFNGKTYLKSSKTTDKSIAALLEIQWRKELFDQSQLGIKPPIATTLAFQRYADSKKSIASHRHLARWAKRFAEYFAHLPYLHELQSVDIEQLSLPLNHESLNGYD